MRKTIAEALVLICNSAGTAIGGPDEDAVRHLEDPAASYSIWWPVERHN